TILARQQAARVHQGAVLERLLHELAHRLQQRGGRRGLAIRLGVADERQVFHGSSFKGSDHATNEPSADRHIAGFFSATRTWAVSGSEPSSLARKRRVNQTGDQTGIESARLSAQRADEPRGRSSWPRSARASPAAR